MNDHHTIVQQFSQAMSDAGITPPADLIGDGTLHRFPLSDRPDDDAGWYVLHLDEIPAGAFGDWRTGVKINWSAKADSSTFSPEEIRHLRNRQRDAKAAAEAQRKTLAAEVAEKAKSMWSGADPAPADHPYLVNKGVKSYGLRTYKDSLLIHLSVDGKIISLQMIFPDGKKVFLKNSFSAGGAFVIGSLTDAPIIVIGEGYATLASIHEATGYPAVVAFNAGNLPEVSRKVRNRFPGADIIIAGDDDHRTDGNPGATTARAVADAIKGRLALPDFGDDRGDKDTDFNDLATRRGLEVVAAQIEAVANPPKPKIEPPPIVPPVPATPGDTDEERPTIRIDVPRLEDMTIPAWRSISETNNPPDLFNFGELLVRIEPSPSGPTIKSLNLDRLKYEVARRLDCITIEKRGKSTVEQIRHPPQALLRDMLATPMPPVPSLEGMIYAPTVSKSGNIRTTSGYDHESQLFLTSDFDRKTPSNPTKSDAISAAQYITTELFADFPYAGEADRAHAVAALLLPFYRQHVELVPMHLIDAPKHGTGKGLHATAEILPGLGGVIDRVSLITEGRDDDEYRKRITSALRQAKPIILIDNITHNLDSGALAAMLTTSTWTDRVLGKSELITLPVRCQMIATGNNPILSGEMARRVYRTRLVPKTDKPWERQGFRHHNLTEWLRDNLSTIQLAALTIVKAWHDAGQPLYTTRTLGSFERWAEVTGGILEFCGVPGFLDNATELFDETDHEGGAWRALTEEWYEQLSTTVVGTGQVFELAKEIDGIDLGNGSERSQRTKFGTSLSRQRDTIHGVYQILSAGTRKRTAVYKLVKVENAQ